MAELENKNSIFENREREAEVALLESWGYEYNFPEVFTQRDFEKYQTLLRKKRGPDENVALSVYRGLVVQVAIEMGWVSGIKDTGDEHPARISHLSGVIHADVLEATTLPNA